MAKKSLTLSRAKKQVTQMGRPKNGTEQRSVRLFCGVWDALDDLCTEWNEGRDPLTDGTLKPSSLVNLAIRDWLHAQGVEGVYVKKPKKASTRKIRKAS